MGILASKIQFCRYEKQKDMFIAQYAFKKQFSVKKYYKKVYSAKVNNWINTSHWSNRKWRFDHIRFSLT